MKGDLKVFYRTKDNKCLCLKHALIQMEQVDTYVSRQETTVVFVLCKIMNV